MNETEINIPEVRAKIAEYLATHDIPSGLGNENSACTIAAINLAITGRVTDGLHPCMCPIIRAWTIRMQDRMPAAIRNSESWKSLVPFIAGSRKPGSEKARLDFIFSEMWHSLELFQPTAESLGFGAQWSAMTTKQTYAACIAARKSATATATATAIAIATATTATATATAIATAYAYAIATDAAATATAATYATAATAAAAATAESWEKIAPHLTLAKLLNL